MKKKTRRGKIIEEKRTTHRIIILKELQIIIPRFILKNKFI